MAESSFNRERLFFTSKLDLNLRKKLVKCYIWSIALCGSETWSFRKVDQKYLESLELLCFWRKKKISWTDRVRNEEFLHRAKEERNILHTVKRTKANWIGPIVRRNCLLKHVIEGKKERRIEVTESWRRRRKQLLDGGGENAERGSTRSHCEENSLWKRLWTCCRHKRMNGPVVDTRGWMMNEYS